MAHINIYGDRDANKIGGYGYDISSQRLDNLDKFALLHLIKSHRKGFIDIGCGYGRVGLIAALMSENTILIDSDIDISVKVDMLRTITNSNVKFFNMDVRELTPYYLRDIDIVYSQRFIHYLKYNEAKELLTMIYNNTGNDLYLFISASGINSELGNNYQGKEINIQDRYFPLDKDIATKHNILGNVCLYSENDLIELAENAGFKKEKVYSSKFGNIKGVFKKP